jgi:predicted acyl esterase
VATNPIPVFQVQGFTDDLFTLEEARRMLQALKAVNPAYPISSYFGDIGHPRASNKPAEVDYALDLIGRWIRAYLNDVPGDEPAPAIYAAITRPRTPTFNPADVIRVTTWEELTTSVLTHRFQQGAAVLVNPVSGAASGPLFDPLLGAGAATILDAGELKPFTAPAPRPYVPDPSLAAYELPVSSLTAGESLLIAGQPIVHVSASTAAPRVQLDVRLLDVYPDRTVDLITRGTITVDAGLRPIGEMDVAIRTGGNLWSAPRDHVLRLEIASVDNPYIAPSRVPSVTAVTKVVLDLPVR